MFQFRSQELYKQHASTGHVSLADVSLEHLPARRRKCVTTHNGGKGGGDALETVKLSECWYRMEIKYTVGLVLATHNLTCKMGTRECKVLINSTPSFMCLSFPKRAADFLKHETLLEQKYRLRN